MTIPEAKSDSGKAATDEQANHDQDVASELAEGAASSPRDFQAEIAGAKAQEAAVDTNSSNQPNTDNTVFAFAVEFYRSKQPPEVRPSKWFR